MTEVHKEKPAPLGQDFMLTFVDLVRKGIESLSVLPNDLSEKIDEAVTETEMRFESRIKANRAHLFKWAGVPDPDQLKALQSTVERLEQRLVSIEENVTALEAHPKGKPWPQELSKTKRARRNRQA